MTNLLHSLSKIKRLFIFLLPVLVLSGCRQDKKNIIIGFSQCTGEDGWRQSQLEEMKRELAFHSNVTFLYKDARESSRRQLRQIKELLSQHIDVLIVSPNEAKPLTPIVNQVYQSGIPVIVVDRKTKSTLYSAYVGADNFQIGFLAGQYISRILHGKGKIVEVQGLSGSTPAIERHAGLMKAIQQHPDIQIIKEIHADWTGPTAAQLLEESKSRVWQADLVFAHNDVMAHASYNMYKLWGLQSNVKFIGVDAQPGPNLGISMVANGTLTASVLYPTGGKEAIRAAIQAANKKLTQKNIRLTTLVIDSTNVGLMKLQTDKILNQQSDIERQQQLIDEQLRIYKNQKNLLYILLATLIVALILGSVVYLSFRRNKRITKSLKLKNKEIVFQQNKVIEYANQAREATEAKLNFYTNISHEFRTPLTLIFGAIQEIAEKDTHNKLLKNKLTLIRKNAARLFRMVNQLIDYRKIDVNKMNIQVSEIDLVTFLEDIVDSFKSLAQKRNIDLRFHAAEAQMPVWCDPYMMDKVFFNLFSNAFKFTENYGKISISIQYGAGKESVLIEFQDNGKGVKPEDKAKIFELFYQGKNNGSKGFGLGLPLARKFVELHHGSLYLSDDTMPGATFCVTLPVGKAHLLPEEIRTISTIKESIKNWHTPEEIDDLLANPLSPTNDIPQNDHAISILIIEDNTDLLYFLKQRFETKFDVYIAHDGNEGIKKAFETIPDLIICDIVMPNKDGINLTQMMKSNIRTSHIPVILLTARSSEDQQIEGIKALADYYIVKPFDLHFLEVVINTLIKNRENLKEHYSLDCNLDIRQEGPGKLDRRFLNELNAFIDENIENENLNVDSIGKHIGISRVQLYRKINALLGCSVNDLILNKRLTKAKHLLSQGELSIAEVAYQVGFSSPSYFSTAFKKRYNVSPKDWRKHETTN